MSPLSIVFKSFTICYIHSLDNFPLLCYNNRHKQIRYNYRESCGLRMKKLCVIILPVFLSVILSSCAWLYQVTGVESYVSTDELTDETPSTEKMTGDTTANTDKTTIENAAVLQEGCYSNGSYIMELISIDNTQKGGYQLIVYTPQYGIRMFIGSIQSEEGAYTGLLTVTDNDDSSVTLTVEPSEDSQTLYATFLEDGTENSSVSGVYTYYEQQDHAETELLSDGAVIDAGEYSYKGYSMTVVYENNYMRVEILNPLGETLLGVAREAQAPLHSALFEGEWGSTILVAAGDGSGNVVVSGRGGSDRILQYAGTYTLS